MISTQQQEALGLIAEILELSPDVRLGQLFAHLGVLGEAHLGHGLGYIDDDELLSVLYRHRAELQARMQGAPVPSSRPPGSAAATFGTSPITGAAPTAEQSR